MDSERGRAPAQCAQAHQGLLRLPCDSPLASVKSNSIFQTLSVANKKLLSWYNFLGLPPFLSANNASISAAVSSSTVRRKHPSDVSSAGKSATHALQSRLNSARSLEHDESGLLFSFSVGGLKFKNRGVAGARALSQRMMLRIGQVVCIALHEKENAAFTVVLSSWQRKVPL